MAQYIDKYTLVVEIVGRMKYIISQMSKFYYASNFKEWGGMVKAYKTILSFINAIEAKEVDLEKEIDHWWWGKTWQTYGMALNPGNIRDFARHFFELGLNTNHKSIGTVSNLGSVQQELASEEPIGVGFECIPVMASTETGKSEYQIRATVTEETLNKILKTRIIKML